MAGLTLIALTRVSFNRGSWDGAVKAWTLCFEEEYVEEP
jgi:hypothetical protein